MKRKHLEGREACPLLPGVDRVLTAEVTAVFKRSYNVDFYLAALRYAQSLWLEGKAAQALLQLNKSLMAELSGGEDAVLTWPLPYAAKCWVMENCPADEFLGNPVRHYQHLATRMRGPRSELRRWRAWACFHLAEAVVDQEANPRDQLQITREGVEVPGFDEVLAHLARLGIPREEDLVREVAAGRGIGSAGGDFRP